MNGCLSPRFTTGIVLFLVACATPTTRPPEVSREAVVAEEAIQRRFVIAELENSQRRLDNIGFPLLLAATPLCSEHTTQSIGVRARTVSDYAEEFVDAVSALSVTDTLTILGVAAGSPAGDAGLAIGDKILRSNGQPVPPGQGAAEVLADAIASADAAPVRLDLRRGGTEWTVRVTPVMVCDYDLVVTAQGDINAYADGERVIVPWPMMRFANDEELTNIVGHEIAHNAMGHIDVPSRT